jgi:hypothetical protein
LSAGGSTKGIGLAVLILCEANRKTDDEGDGDEDHCASYFQVLGDHHCCSPFILYPARQHSAS